MCKTCLVVIYNHNYEKNVPVLNRIYAGRFTHVVHVMPFYRGHDSSVIGVYENSFQFSGYIALAYLRLKALDCERYVFVADDMILNPTLAEDDLDDFLSIDGDTCVTTGLRLIGDRDFLSSSLVRPSVINLNFSCNACEWRKFLPDLDEAWRRFSSHGFTRDHGVSRRLYDFFSMGQRVMRKTYFHTQWIPPFKFLTRFGSFFSSDEKLYPLATGYSDFLIVPKERLSDFAHACGVFAATRVFVEVAIPTALVLSSEKIKLLGESGVKFETGVGDYSVRKRMEDEFGLDYRQLVSRFPGEFLFIHPIKLSRWSNLP